MKTILQILTCLLVVTQTHYTYGNHINSCTENGEKNMPQDVTSVIELLEQPNDMASYGSEKASVRIILFTDFECGYCAQANSMIQAYRQAYPGKIRVITKNLPLSFHEKAEKAAIAALAAGKQGKYEAYSKLLYLYQDELTDAKLREIAVRLRLDLLKFSEDLNDPELKNRVLKDKMLAAGLNINSTPTILINGQRVENEQFFTELDQWVDQPERGQFSAKSSLKDCTEEQKEEILAPATQDKLTVKVKCHLKLKPGDVITKRLIYEGAEVSSALLDCNGATLNGAEGTLNTGRDMIDIRSKRIKENDKGGEWSAPKNIVIRNCKINGSVRIRGMAFSGEDEYLKISSRFSGHTGRARANAPKNIVLKNLTITGVSRIPLYIAPGVTKVRLVDSEIKGKSKATAIYLDAESGYNVIKNNRINVFSQEVKAGIYSKKREQLAIDGSSNNLIINNTFTGLGYRGNYKGIYLYRNCGEKGTIRHNTPKHNQIINNVFRYDHYDPATDKGQSPAIFIGARDGKGFRAFPEFGHCDQDNGYDFGSSKSDLDYAQFNIVIQNQITKRPLNKAIKIGNSGKNTNNLVTQNRVVAEVKEQSASCYLRGIIPHSRYVFINQGRTKEGPRTYRYTCKEGELSKVKTSPMKGVYWLSSSKRKVGKITTGYGEAYIQVPDNKSVITGVGARVKDGNVVGLRLQVGTINNSNYIVNRRIISAGTKLDEDVELFPKTTGNYIVVGMGVRAHDDNIANLYLYARELNPKTGKLGPVKVFPAKGNKEVEYLPDHLAYNEILTGLSIGVSDNKFGFKDANVVHLNLEVGKLQYDPIAGFSNLKL